MISAVALAGFNLFFFTALAATGVAVGTVVAIGSAPVFAGLLGWFLRNERPSGGWMLATVLAIAGCVLLFLNQEDVVVNSLGIVYALSAGFSYSTYTLFSKSLLEKHHPYAVLSLVFLFSAAVLIVLSLGQSFSWVFTSRGIAVSMLLGLITASLAFKGEFEQLLLSGDAHDGAWACHPDVEFCAQAKTND